MVEKNIPPKSAREPQALSSEYHKARKQLMLWAGILFVWELVGIDLEKAKETGGNAGAIITAIKSPQAIPWVLLILVAYLLFKTTIEWHQCSFARRQLRVSRVDFVSAWVVSLGAYVLYVFQAVKKVQVADVVQGGGTPFSTLFTLPLSFMVVFQLIFLVDMRLRLRKDYQRPIWDLRMIVSLLTILTFPVALWLVFRTIGMPMQWSAKLTLLGITLAILTWAGIKGAPIGFKIAKSAVRRWISFPATKATESPDQANT